MNLTKLLLVVMTLVLTSCASILNEETTPVNINTSNGESANVLINGQTYEVPGTIKLARSKDAVIIKPKTKGCAPVTMKSKVTGVFFLNIFIGGTLGSTTDYGSSNMWDYEDSVIIPCESKKSSKKS